MPKAKIMLYFEDTIDIHGKEKDANFIQIVRSRLSSDYSISQEYGKVGKSKGNKLFFYSRRSGKTLYPSEELRNTNSKEVISKMPGLKINEVPFFVIDTDGIPVSKFFKKILGISENGGESKDPNKWISGKSDLLPILLKDIYDHHIFSNSPHWGLVLVNPNQEGSYLRSLNTHASDFDKIIFGEPKDGIYHYSCLGISYWSNKFEQSFIAANGLQNSALSGEVSHYSLLEMLDNPNPPDIHAIGTAIKENHKEIWKKLLREKPEILSNSISSDISEYYRIIVDTILENPKFSQYENNDKYTNAKNSIFSIYLKKRKTDKTPEGKIKTHKQYPNGLPAEYLNITNLGISDNLDIQYSHFGSI